MTARRAIAAAFALALVVIGVWFWQAQRPPPDIYSDATASASGSINRGTTSDPKPASRDVAAATESSPLANSLNAPASDIRADLRVVAEILEAFRSNFPQAGNPVGTNAEITAALTGKNRLRLALIPANHSAINREGELCDRWGTPFFFHAESAAKMEIRSAGPDRKMWTADDVTFVP